MTSPAGDPTYIKNKDKYFIEVARTLASASTHPKVPGACVIVRDREIVGSGRSLYTDSGTEIDCVSYAIAAAAKTGTPLIGGVCYSTRYPFSTPVFQLYLMGIKRIVTLSHAWETYYKDELRKAGRLARELSIAIEPIFLDEDPRFGVNTYDRDETKEFFPDANPFATDEYDPKDATDSQHEDSTTF